jgi:hypothetical protein
MTRPIDTAPTDGSPMLGVRNGRHIGIVSYDPVNLCWANTLDGEDYALLAKAFWPTHWIPLPAIDEYAL